MTELIYENFREQFRTQFSSFTADKQLNIAYFDNGATSLRPKILGEYYLQQLSYAGMLDPYSSLEMSELLNNSSKELLSYLNVTGHLIWSSGATDSINYLTVGLESYMEQQFSNHGVLLIAQANHNANSLPWIELARKYNLKIVALAADLENNQAVSLTDLQAKLIAYQDKVAVVALPSVNNSHGIKSDLTAVSKRCRELVPNALLVIDHAQGLAYNNPAIIQDCDAIVGSFHKMFGPTGLGFLIISPKLKELLVPHRLGGGIVKDASLDPAQYKLHKNPRMPGTHNYQAIALIEPLIKWWRPLQQPAYQATLDLVAICKQQLQQFAPFIKLAPCDTSVINLIIEDGLDVDLEIFLKKKRILSRSGKQCAYPWYQELDQDSGLRLTFAGYNNLEDLERLIAAIKEFKELYE